MNNRSTDETKPQSFIAGYAKLIVAFAVLCGSTSGSFGSMISAPATVIGFWRLTIALPFFLVPVLIREDSRRAMLRVSGANLLRCFISGAALFSHYYCWFNAVKQTDVASASVLGSLHPLVVLLITVFVFRKRVSWKSVAAIIAALLGGVLIVWTGESGGSFNGNMLAFLSAVFLGIYFALNGRIRRDVEGSLCVLLVFGACWICFGIANAVTGTPLAGYPGRDYIFIVLLTLICQIGCHGLLNLCIGHVSPLYVSTVESADPVFSAIVALVMVQQVPRPMVIIGCVIVVCAILFYNKFERETLERSKEQNV